MLCMASLGYTLPQLQLQEVLEQREDNNGILCSGCQEPSHASPVSRKTFILGDSDSVNKRGELLQTLYAFIVLIV